MSFNRTELQIVTYAFFALYCAFLVLFATFISAWSTDQVIVNINPFGEKYFELIGLVVLFVISSIALCIILKNMNKNSLKFLGVRKNE